MKIDDAIQMQCDIIKRDIDLITVREPKAQLIEIDRMRCLLERLKEIVADKAKGKTQW